jgi:hypothetical protein
LKILDEVVLLLEGAEEEFNATATESRARADTNPDIKVI